MGETTLQGDYSCSMQKRHRKNSEYSENESVSKIGKMATMQRL